MSVLYTTESNYFDTAKDILNINDHIEMDVNVTGWDKTLRLRSLSIKQREKINIFAGIGDKRDIEKFHVMSLVEGIIRPILTPTEAAELVSYHNGQIIEELTDAIWSIGGLYETYNRYREALENAKSTE